MHITETGRTFSLSALLDYFIPMELQIQPDTHRRARMFMLSHICGPFLGNVIPLYLHFVNKIPADFRFWTFFISVTAFWFYPFVLRYTKMYRTLAFISIQNLNFCILWACFSYGGIYSPFLPWVLVIPVLSFLYLPATGLTRVVILTQIYTSVCTFAALVICGYDFPKVDLQQLQIIGVISIISASIYVVIMAFYFANAFREQKDFETELSGLVAAADNLRNLTLSAHQATAAKADFVASMSHELRTPLNAVIGYSQLMLEDAEETGDDDMVVDIEKIHLAGTQLLTLVDDILDFSKIEANKMETQSSSLNLLRGIGLQMEELKAKIKARQYSLKLLLPHEDPVLKLDWQSIGKSIDHVIAGVTSKGSGGEIQMAVRYQPNHELEIEIVDPAVYDTKFKTEGLFDIFADDSDASTTKYGGAGISLALSQKFAELVGGRIRAASNDAGKRVFTMNIPALTAS